MRDYKDDKNDMRTAYEETIKDFEIELENTRWWEFKYIVIINDRIQHFKEKLEALND